MPFTSGAALLPALPRALFRSTTDTLHNAALIHANKIRNGTVERATSKLARSNWKACLSKAHPDAFSQAFPKHDLLPPADNPFIQIVRPSSVGNWPARCGYENWHTNEANMLPLPSSK
jgi:hypothetical protein